MRMIRQDDGSTAGAFEGGQREAERERADRAAAQRRALQADGERLDGALTPPGEAVGARAPLPKPNGPEAGGV